MEGRDTEDSWGDRVTQRPVTLSHEYNVKPSRYKHPVSAREIMYAGGAAEGLNWFMSLPK